MGRNSQSGRTAAATADATSPQASPSLPPHVYYVEAGFLAVGNLLRPDEWVKDECRSHCNICMQQFHTFRRRHHCRTCGEVLCHSCAKHKKIRLIQLNYDLGVRICTFCVMQATDATQDVRRRSKSPMVRVVTSQARESMGCRILGRPGGNDETQDLPEYVAITDTMETAHVPNVYSSFANEKVSDMTWRLTSQTSLGRALPTTGDSTVVMSKLDGDRLADTFAPDDNTMNVLLHLVASSLYCHMVCIGLEMPSSTANSQFQASFGLPPTLSPSDVCSLVWTHEGSSSVIHHDTLNGETTCPPALLAHGIRYFAGVPIRVNEVTVGVIVAMDVVPHTQTSLEQRNTLESAARIAAEVLEERAAVVEGGKQDPRTSKPSLDDLASESPETFEPIPQDAPNEPVADDVATVDSFDTATAPSITTPSTSGASSDMRGALVGRRRQASNATAYDHAIHSAMMFYRALLRSAWELEREVDGTRLFSLDERYEWGYLKATKVVTVDGKADWNKLLDLRHAKVYGDIIASSTKHKMVDLHTTIDLVRFHPATFSRSSSAQSSSDEVQLLCHRRQYPGGAWTMLAVDTSDMQFVFAWLISPYAVDQVLVSVIVPHVAAGLTDLLLVRLLAQVQTVTANLGDLRLSACSGTADILETRGGRAYSCSVIPAPTSKVDGTAQQRSRFWDLLGKTILTQQLLSQQQTSMMETLNENADKLRRLSHAVDRVESLLEAKLV